MVVVRQRAAVLLVPDGVAQLLPEEGGAAQLVVDGRAVLEAQIELVSVPDDEADDLFPEEQVPHLGVGDFGGSGGAVEEVVGAQKDDHQGEIDAQAGAVSLLRQKITPFLPPLRGGGA